RPRGQEGRMRRLRLPSPRRRRREVGEEGARRQGHGQRGRHLQRPQRRRQDRHRRRGPKHQEREGLLERSEVIAALLLALCAQDGPKFREQLVDDKLGDLWACSTADVDGDGKPDLLALSWEPSSVVWYENPTPSAPLGASWKKHVLIEKDPRELVVIHPIQIDGK